VRSVEPLFLSIEAPYPGLEPTVSASQNLRTAFGGGDFASATDSMFCYRHYSSSEAGNFGHDHPRFPTSFSSF